MFLLLKYIYATCVYKQDIVLGLKLIKQHEQISN